MIQQLSHLEPFRAEYGEWNIPQMNAEPKLTYYGVISDAYRRAGARSLTYHAAYGESDR